METGIKMPPSYLTQQERVTLNCTPFHDRREGKVALLRLATRLTLTVSRHATMQMLRQMADDLDAGRSADLL
jgi:hypothetical protein